MRLDKFGLITVFDEYEDAEDFCADILENFGVKGEIIGFLHGMGEVRYKVRW